MITIIIPTYNSEKYIGDCLDSVFAQSYKYFTVVVFDNASRDRTVDLTQRYPVTVVRNDCNHGWSKANNICVAKATTKYVFLLNVDTVLHRDCLQSLVAFAESHPDVACISPAIVEYDALRMGSAGPGFPVGFDVQTGLLTAYRSPEVATEVSFVPGTAMFANRESLGSELYFREDFFMYHEDVEFSLRVLSRTKLQLYLLQTAVVGHDSKQSYARFATARFILRNMFTCLTEYQDWRTFLRHYPSYAKNLLRLYASSYRRYYPVAYPLLSAYYLVTSLLKMRSRAVDLTRVERINWELTRYPKQFEFIL
jgi:GT2 family glycosyltransferase